MSFSDFLLLAFVAFIALVIYQNLPRPSAREKILQETREWLERIQSRQDFGDPQELAASIVIPALGGRFEEDSLRSAVIEAVGSMAFSLSALPELFDDSDLSELTKARKVLEARQRFINRGYLDKWAAYLTVLVETLLEDIPQTVGDSAFSSRLLDHVDPRPFIGTIYKYILDDPNVFPEFAKEIENRVQYIQSEIRQEQLDNMTGKEIVDLHLGKLPFHEIFYVNIGFDIPQKKRFQHTHILGGSGHGKTQLIQYLLTREEGGFCVIDSQEDLIQNVARRFDNVVLLDPTDVEHPLALNLFDMKIEGEGRAREELYNATISLYEYIFGALLGAGGELTARQSTLFGFLAELMLSIEGSTIHTLIDVIQNHKDYQGQMEALGGTAAAFFRNEFSKKMYDPTRDQITARLYNILKSPAFDRMFNNKKNLLDIGKEMNDGKIILINTAKYFFQEGQSAIIGRFFIALLMQAAIRRLKLPKSKRNPYFIYVDEANDYFDNKIDTMLNQARKANIGMILSHQHLSQIKDRELRGSIMQSTAIKFAGGVPEDIIPMGRIMQLDKEGRREMHDLKSVEGKYAEWMCFIRGEGARKIICPFGVLENAKKKSREDYQKMIEENRARLCLGYSGLVKEGTATNEPLPEQDSEKSDKEEKADKGQPPQSDDDIWG